MRRKQEPGAPWPEDVTIEYTNDGRIIISRRGGGELEMMLYGVVIKALWPETFPPEWEEPKEAPLE